MVEVTYVSLSHAGVQPRIKKDGPSARKDSRRSFNPPCTLLSNHVLAISFTTYWSLPPNAGRALAPSAHIRTKITYRFIDQPRCLPIHDTYVSHSYLGWVANHASNATR